MSRRLLGVILLLAGVAVALGLGVRWFQRRNAASNPDDATPRPPEERSLSARAGDAPSPPAAPSASSETSVGFDVIRPPGERAVGGVEPERSTSNIDAATSLARDIDAALPTGANSDLPAAPSREDLVAAFAAIAPAVARCSDLQTRVVPVTVVISGDGTVTRAAPTANYPAGGVADCVAHATRALRVRPFRSSQMTVVYPFLFD